MQESVMYVIHKYILLTTYTENANCFLYVVYDGSSMCGSTHVQYMDGSTVRTYVNTYVHIIFTYNT